MSEVTQQKKREAIAMRVGHSVFLWNYFDSLDGCHAAELALSDEQHRLFREVLWDITQPDGSEPIHISGRTHNRAYISAAAEQRAEALYQAITQNKIQV